MHICANMVDIYYASLCPRHVCRLCSLMLVDAMLFTALMPILLSFIHIEVPADTLSYAATFIRALYSLRGMPHYALERATRRIAVCSPSFIYCVIMMVNSIPARYFHLGRVAEFYTFQRSHYATA